MSEHLSQREWKFKTPGDDPKISGDRLEALASETGLSAITLKVCIQRGLEDPQSIQKFLHPRLELLTDPLLIKDMNLAVERIAQVRTAGQKVRIYGDYDVDGTTGAALLAWFFRDAGVDADVRQPDRFKDGYGLGAKAVQIAHDEGVQLLVSVDCGISSFEAADLAKQLGVDLIIVDHHQIDPVKGIPQAIAVLNPQREDCPSQLKQLCGCGLAFYLARALRSYGRVNEWWSAGQEPNLKTHLDLVVMATAADMVPLTGDNHTLVRHGLEILKKSQKPGVAALLTAAGLGSRELSPGHLGFVLGPRINASGRMGSASLALELLTTLDPVRAKELAEELEKINQERAEIQNKIWDEVKTQVEAGLALGRFKHGIVVADAGWHEGVVGIVASRVTEFFKKPAAILALREDFGKGSVRTFAGKDVLSALRSCSNLLLGFGGHRHAAGLSVSLDQWENFRQAFDDALGELGEDAQARPLWLDGECTIPELDIKTLQELENLGPFGPGNPEPLVRIQARIGSHRILKERHLKLSLSSSAQWPVSAIDAIWFHGVEHEAQILEGAGDSFDWVGVPELNRFRGSVTPTLRVRDCRGLNQ